MKIMLSRTLRIVAEDGLSFTLEVMKVRGEEAKRPGEQVWKVMGYYGTLEQAARAALNKGIAQNGSKLTAERLLDALLQAGKTIARACEGAMSSAHASEFEGVVEAADLPQELFEV